MRKGLIILIGLLLINSDVLFAQDRFEQFMATQSNRKRIPEKIVRITRVDAPITIDGDLTDWPVQGIERAGAFRQYFPTDTARAETRTEVMFAYDRRNFYVGIIGYDELPGDYIVQSLRRDFSGRLNDHITIYLDPFDDLSNGFVFGITPFGVVTEGIISGGDDVSSTWDNVWFSEAQQKEDRWEAEVRIPFKTIRYNNNSKNWNVQIYRNDLKRNERSTWTSVPRQFRPWALPYSGSLLWDELPPKSGSNLAIIPYLTGSVQKDFESGTNAAYDGNAGFDAKVAVSSSLNLDLTVNPDFSQVDVDQQVTNLSRFELFFPERRQFFIENSDLFGDFGFRSARPFFTRRIGLTSQILAGARLSGKVGDTWRVGLLNIQTRVEEDPDDTDIPAYNFGVFTFQKQVFGRSNIAGIMVNKQALNYQKGQSEEGLDFSESNEFSRVYGLEYNLLSKDNRWSGKAFLFKSDDPDGGGHDLAHGAFVNRRWSNLRLGWSHEYVGDDYNAETGFTPRRDYFRFGPFGAYDFYPPSMIINRHGPSFRYRTFYNTQSTLTDRFINLSYAVRFTNSSELEFSVDETFIQLRRDFDPSRKSRNDTTVVPLPSGSEHQWFEYGLQYSSDSRKNVFINVSASTGGFYAGRRSSYDGRINFRFPPMINIGMRFSYDEIRMPAPFEDASFWLIGPTFDFTFTDRIFWTTFVQYNQQANNLNINSRFQWRFRPVSDVFLVYTDNYFPETMKAKNRALVFKISYWFNL